MNSLIDRHIRLVLTPEGPAYQSLEALNAAKNVRRVGHVYYTQDFASLVFREMILNDSKASTRERVCFYVRLPFHIEKLAAGCVHATMLHIALPSGS